MATSLSADSDINRSEPLDWPERLTFAAKRTDGLGERLRSLVNAKALADYFGKDFAFDWPDKPAHLDNEHALGKPNEIFSAEFMQRYLKPLSNGIRFSDFIKTDSNKLDGSTVIMPPANPNEFVEKSRTLIPASEFPKAFWGIDFSDSLKRAIELAKAVDLDGGSVALHLRAGDVIYGKYRFMRRWYEKVVPYPLALDFLETARSEGRVAIIFGQDAEFIHAMCRRTGSRFAADYHKQYNFDKFQAAIFDIVLMARCQTVLAGESGFALLAETIGGFQRIGADDIWSTEDAKSILLVSCLDSGQSQDKFEAPQLQQAFACSYASHVYSDVIAADTRVRLLREALRLDPVNSYYAVVLAAELARLNKFEEADAELAKALRPASRPSSPHGALLAVVKHRTPPDDRPVLHHCREALELMAHRGSITAAAICAALAGARADQEAFRFFDKLASDLPASPLARRLEVLRLPADVNALRTKLEASSAEVARLKNEVASLKKKVRTVERSRDTIAKRRDDVINSVYWRLTLPMRLVGDFARGVQRRLLTRNTY